MLLRRFERAARHQGCSVRRVMPDKRADILVIGLGPAGARAAARAAAQGLRVVGLDRRQRAGHPVQCAEFVPVMLGQELDGLRTVTAQRITEMVTFVGDEAPDVKGDFPGLMIDRGHFDTALAEEALDAGADLRFGVGIRSVASDGAVTLTSGKVIRGRVLIGADGARSRVGLAVGRVNVSLVETRQATVPLMRPHGATDIFLSADIVGGYGWLFPKDTVANVGVGVAPRARHRLKPLLDGLHGELVREGRVGRCVLGCTGGPIPVGGMVDPVARLGETLVLLAGDAAGLANPVTGAGIAAAVISGGLAGEAAVGWLAGDKAAPAGYAEELETLFKPALNRALARRRELVARYATEGVLGTAQLRRGWIAFPEYWAA